MSTNRTLLLQDRLHAGEAELRRAALRELLREGGAATESLRWVLPLVVDHDGPTRDLAAEVLDKIARPAAQELGGLMQTLRETTDGELEYWATTLIGRLGPLGAPATGLLATVLLDSACLAARERAAWALAEIGPAARAAMNSLRQIGHDDPPRLRRLAESALLAVSGRAAA